MKVREISGKITLADGSISEFSITADLGWQQWGAEQSRLGETVEVLDVLTNGLAEENLMASEEDEEDEAQELPELETVTTQDQARQIAIDWQHSVNGSTTYGELSEAEDYFRELAEKYDLVDEFVENGII